MKRLVMILMVVLLVSVLSGCSILRANGYADGRENLRDKDVEDILSRAAEFGLSSDQIPWERFLTPAQRVALELIRSQMREPVPTPIAQRYTLSDVEVSPRATLEYEDPDGLLWKLGGELNTNE